jgi:N-acyl-D-aspartate/D-glutamate deacylase
MHEEGLQMRAQVAVRPIGILIGLQATVNPLESSAAYREVAAAVHDISARARQLSEPEVRARVLADLRTRPDNPLLRFELMFPMDEDRPDYEPKPEASIAALAARDGVEPPARMYDEFLRDEGRALVYVPIINYATGNLDHVAEMLRHPWCVPGLSDGGAHVGTICDASFPTTLLQHWGRDRTRGRLPVELLIGRQSRATAEAVGLFDRGVLAPGRRADLNIIDVDNLAVERPRMAFDLPAGGKRLLQRARGYRHTFVRGVETYHDGEATGALPGRLVRGASKG